MTKRKPDAGAVINGRAVRATSRRGCIEVEVYDGPEATGEPAGQWDMPKRLGLHGAMTQAEAQTDRAAVVPPESIAMLKAAPEHGIDLGEVGYKAYGEYAGYETYDGRAMPRWDALPDRTRRCWRVAAERIQQAVIGHGPLNPDHLDCQLCDIIEHQ